MRFVRALIALVGAVAAAIWKLFAATSTSPSPSTKTEPLNLAGTGGHYNARTGNYDNGQDPFGSYPNDERRL